MGIRPTVEMAEDFGPGSHHPSIRHASTPDMKGISLASTTTPSVSVDHLRDENGYFSMVAVDQRGSLRAMLAEHAGGRMIGDDDLAQFKLDVATELAPGASALLLDRDYGSHAAGASPSTCCGACYWAAWICCM